MGSLPGAQTQSGTTVPADGARPHLSPQGQAFTKAAKSSLKKASGSPDVEGSGRDSDERMKFADTLVAEEVPSKSLQRSSGRLGG